MRTSEGTTLVVCERGETTAFGPRVRGERDPCLACVLRRRAATAVPLGPVRIVEVPDPDVGSDRHVLDDHQVVDGTAHRFLPLPACQCARTRSGRPASHLDVFSPRLGLIERVELSQVSSGSPDEVEVVARSVAARTRGTDGTEVFAPGTGRGPDAGTALGRAVHESLERYSAAFWGHSPATTPLGGGPTAVLPARRVTRGGSDGDDVVHVPAHQVFLPFPGAPGEQDSAGLSADQDLWTATARAVAEQVERRVFALAVSPRTHGVRARTRLTGDGVRRLTWATRRGHAVVCVVATSPTPPFLTLGLGCATSEDDAHEKAGREHRHVVEQVAAALASGADPSDHRSQLDRMLWRVATDRRAAAAVLARLSRPGRADAELDPERDLAVVEVTTPDVAATGVHVVRAVPVAPQGSAPRLL